MQLFDWLYPRYLPLFVKAVEVWYDEPFVTTPVLKLMAELVQNRSQRLTFEISSPNGILLFREASRLVCTYGSRILNLNVTTAASNNASGSGGSSGILAKLSNTDTSKDQVYPLKLKGIAVCFNILKWSLSGMYVNFGVFQLYNDNALNDSLEIFVKLLLSFQQTDLVVYAKLSQAYYGLLEILTADHMVFLAMLEPQVFLYILSTISDGLASIDSIISTSCCTALDHVISYLFKSLSKQKRQQNNQPQQQQQQMSPLLEVYHREPRVFQQLLTTLINIILFEDCRNQWSMSRPLLGLILLNEEVGLFFPIYILCL
jgi:exportin-7